jgi:ubiquinol-cytochrome c reductase cytochrome c subunit
MILRALIIGALAGTLCGPALAQQAQPPATPPAGNAANGKTLYVQEGCYECHGTVGQGSTFSGPRLASPVLPAAGFIKQLRQPRFEMPPYTDKVISDAQVGDIIAYLQSVPRPAAADSIALLK